MNLVLMGDFKGFDTERIEVARGNVPSIFYDTQAQKFLKSNGDERGVSIVFYLLTVGIAILVFLFGDVLGGMQALDNNRTRGLLLVAAIFLAAILALLEKRLVSERLSLSDLNFREYRDLNEKQEFLRQQSQQNTALIISYVLLIAVLIISALVYADSASMLALGIFFLASYAINKLINNKSYLRFSIVNSYKALWGYDKEQRR